MGTMRSPDYVGGGLVNLSAELEQRLGGGSASPGLTSELAAPIPNAETYVLVLFDGLGDLQIASHPEAADLKEHRAGALDAPFSTQTSVATATLATGLPPSRHGLVSYLMRLPECDIPVSTLWWSDVDGATVDVDLGAFLPAPNMAERLTSLGAEAVVVEPAIYLGGPLDRVLYRGAQTRGVEHGSSIAETVLEEASRPGRLVICYLPHVDVAGHAEGTGSGAYVEALRAVTREWQTIGEGLPSHAALIGTADHGMVDVAPDDRIDLDPPSSLILYGDDRVIYVDGEPGLAAEYAAGLPATWLPIDEARHLWGPGPFHPQLDSRLPEGLIIADDNVALHYPGNQIHLVGYHGGLSEDELRIPLLVWNGDV